MTVFSDALGYAPLYTLLITFLGGVIGTIVTAMYMPMYTIIKYF